MPSRKQLAGCLVALVILAGAALPFSALAQAQDLRFTYRIFGYPAQGDCHVIATDLGHSFAAATGIPAETARCVNITTTHFDFEITYLAPDPLDLVTTEERSAGNGVYARLATCELAIQQEKEHYEQVTGLTAVAAYCQRLTRHTGRPYTPRVDGFGDPLIRPYMSWTVLLDPPVDMVIDDLETQIENAFRARGFDARSVRVTEGLYGEIYVRYYAENRIRVESEEMSRLPNLTACEEQLVFAQQIQHTQTLPPLALYCGRGMTGKYYIKGFYQDLHAGSSLDSAELYPTYAACKANRAAIVSAYNGRMNGTVTGGVCTMAVDRYLDPEGYRVRLFRR